MLTDSRHSMKQYYICVIVHMLTMENEDCQICTKPILKIEAFAILTSKGCNAIHKASEAKGSVIETIPGQKVHQNCRKDYCRQSSINAQNRNRPLKLSNQP